MAQQTYTLEIRSRGAHGGCGKEAWRMLSGLPPGTPFRLCAVMGRALEVNRHNLRKATPKGPARLDARGA
jgi:hypothetical protein